MEWTTCIKEAIRYMEEHLLEIWSPEEVAEYVHVSTMYLQNGFQIMTGYTLGEYIRNRRLYLAAMELLHGDEKVIDIAYRYGYETPESFTKAFVRFHGASPTKIRRKEAPLKTFLPLRVNIVIQGGESMDFRVEKMAAFTVIGFAREFTFEESHQAIPAFWDEIFEKHEARLDKGDASATEIEKAIVSNRIGEFGICIDDIGKDGKFLYMVAGRYSSGPIPEGLSLYKLTEEEWAVFKCFGPLPEALQTVNDQIWNEWLPGNRDYELAGKYNVEWYSPSGSTGDLDYQSAIWIPVRRK